ncbi:hypothetical protein C8R46DRAFT_1361683 [Mycena filopes]|nr:hypothetical protein C8R46DRAFT_1361683 [Mycena filopes]
MDGMVADAFSVQTSFTSLQISRSTNFITLGFVVAFGGALLSRVATNLNAPRCVSRKLDPLLAFKALFGGIYIAAAATILGYALKTESAWILPSAAGLVTAKAFLGASISEHHHSIAPSTGINETPILGAVFYGYAAWGLYDNGVPVYFYAHSTAAIALFALTVLESTSKRSLLLPTDPPPAYESTLSFLVKPFFPHLFPLLYVGSKRRLALPELRDIPLHLRADPATERLLAALASEDKSSDRYLVKSTLKVFGYQFLSPVLPRLVMLVATFSQVTLVEQTILYVSDTSIPTERGPFLVCAYFLVYVSLALSNYVFSEQVNLNASVVLYSSLRQDAAPHLDGGARARAGRGGVVHVRRRRSGIQSLQHFWAWRTVGTYVGAAQKIWPAALDTRIKLLVRPSPLFPPPRVTNDALTHTPALDPGPTYIISLAGTLSVVGSSTSFFVTLAAYAVSYAHGWGGIGEAGYESSVYYLVDAADRLLTIVNILREPLAMVGQALPGLFASYASLRRVQGFLKVPEKPALAQSSTPHSPEPVVVDGAPVTVPPVQVSVSLQGCAFQWDEKTEVLRDITLELAPGELHMVVGSVASGKSSLLMSMLQETLLVEGTLRVQARKIALASQTPFIFPGTLRAREGIDILLDSPFDAAFYDEVIDACGLRQDIDALPSRDLVNLGDKVDNQCLTPLIPTRQAIARAVYARADLILLDDVFSALDGETEAHGRTEGQVSTET